MIPTLLIISAALLVIAVLKTILDNILNNKTTIPVNMEITLMIIYFSISFLLYLIYETIINTVLQKQQYSLIKNKRIQKIQSKLKHLEKKKFQNTSEDENNFFHSKRIKKLYEEYYKDIIQQKGLN